MLRATPREAYSLSVKLYTYEEVQDPSYLLKLSYYTARPHRVTTTKLCYR
jgi:hypothetical protein